MIADIGLAGAWINQDGPLMVTAVVHLATPRTDLTQVCRDRSGRTSRHRHRLEYGGVGHGLLASRFDHWVFVPGNTRDLVEREFANIVCQIWRGAARRGFYRWSDADGSSGRRGCCTNDGNTD